MGSGSDTYSYLLALVEENRPGMGKGIRVQTGQRLYCPNAETLGSVRRHRARPSVSSNLPAWSSSAELRSG